MNKANTNKSIDKNLLFSTKKKEQITKKIKNTLEKFFSVGIFVLMFDLFSIIKSKLNEYYYIYFTSQEEQIMI